MVYQQAVKEARQSYFSNAVALNSHYPNVLLFYCIIE